MDIQATDRAMMARCADLAREGAAAGEYPFGSLIARGGTIIAEGVNHSVRELDESRHAEIVAIASARRALGKTSMRECTLYCTVEPCAMCAFCIRAAGIGRVVFALHSPVLGGLSHWEILQDRSLSRRLPFLFRPAPEIAAGVQVEAVQAVWRDWKPLVWWAIRRLGFFVSRRAEASGGRWRGTGSEQGEAPGDSLPIAGKRSGGGRAAP